MSYLRKKLMNPTKWLCNQLGIELVGRRKLPSKAILGLRNYDFETIIDVGANVGQFAQFISAIFPKAHLICFEPLPAAFKILKTWADLHKSIKVDLLNMAVGDSEGQVEMFYHTDHSPSSSLLPSTDTCQSMYPVIQNQVTVSVPLTTLDKALTNNGVVLLGNILIKLDVQGYEDRVLRGGKETFSKARAVILEVCLEKLYENQANFKDIMISMEDLGYNYVGNLDQHYASDGHVIFFDAVFVKKDHAW